MKSRYAAARTCPMGSASKSFLFCLTSSPLNPSQTAIDNCLSRLTIAAKSRRKESVCGHTDALALFIFSPLRVSLITWRLGRLHARDRDAESVHHRAVVGMHQRRVPDLWRFSLLCRSSARANVTGRANQPD